MVLIVLLIVTTVYAINPTMPITYFNHVVLLWNQLWDSVPIRRFSRVFYKSFAAGAWNPLSFNKLRIYSLLWNIFPDFELSLLFADSIYFTFFTTEMHSHWLAFIPHLRQQTITLSVIIEALSWQRSTQPSVSDRPGPDLTRLLSKQRGHSISAPSSSIRKTYADGSRYVHKTPPWLYV